MNSTTIALTALSDATVVTHPAPHHGDETIALAILGLVKGSMNVCRTRNPWEIEQAMDAGITFVDVGGAYNPEAGLFDHHQLEFAEMREDGTKYSSAGLLWREYGADVCIELTGCTQAQAEEAATKVDEMLIKGIDAIDNGQASSNGIMSMYDVISVLNPNWDEPNADSYFLEACQLAHTVLTRTIMFCVAAVRGRDTVEEAIDASKNGIMVLPQFVSGWIDTVVNSTSQQAESILYGVFKNLQGQWSVQALPPREDLHAQRKPLPKAWRGLRGEALAEVTSVEDAVFCHAEGFICGAKSREGALRLAEQAVAATE